MDFGFKFEIGQLVQTVGCLPPSGVGWPKERQKLRIISRVLEECPGGVQRYYNVRAVSSSGGLFNQLINVNEIELMPTLTFEEEEAMDRAAREAKKTSQAPA